MEMEYKDPSKRGKFIVVMGVVLALVAGGAAFFLINQAQQQAGQGSLQKVSVVVAARPIPARKPVEADDVVVREVPLDPTNSAAIAVTKPEDVIGHVLAVSVVQDQMLTLNMLATTATGGGQFSILNPGETVAPDSEAWRAVAITVPDERAVGGLIEVGMTVDILATATVNVPENLSNSGRYYTDKSTKVVYQNMIILAKAAGQYILKAPLRMAEEITHLQAAGNATFSMLLRPEADVRIADATTLGETTNRIIARYGLPIPEVYPPGNGPLPTPLPLASPTPIPTVAPSESPGSFRSPAPSTAP
jgi:Flp pilus assembly protein CpaB